MPNYTREQLDQLYKNLPEELKEWVSSDEMNDQIYQILDTNGLLDKRDPQISALIRNVLYGVLPPTDFQSSLERDVKLKGDLAKKIGQEINRFIFFPVKESLAGLYSTDMGKTRQKDTAVQSEATAAEGTPASYETKPDTYREPLE